MMKKHVPAWLLITGEFIVFCGLVTLFHLFEQTTDSVSFVAEIYLLSIVLLMSILLTMRYTAQQQETITNNLKKELAAEKREYQTIQAKFDEAIEKRTFELQRVNGALNREIAERIQAEEEVRGLQKQLHLILDSAGEGILGLDNKGKVTFMNKAASLMLGWEPDDLIRLFSQSVWSQSTFAVDREIEPWFSVLKIQSNSLTGGDESSFISPQ